MLKWNELKEDLYVRFTTVLYQRQGSSKWNMMYIDTPELEETSFHYPSLIANAGDYSRLEFLQDAVPKDIPCRPRNMDAVIN